MILKQGLGRNGRGRGVRLVSAPHHPPLLVNLKAYIARQENCVCEAGVWRP